MKTVAVGLPHVTALSSSLTFGGRLQAEDQGLVLVASKLLAWVR